MLQSVEQLPARSGPLSHGDGLGDKKLRRRGRGKVRGRERERGEGERGEEREKR